MTTTAVLRSRAPTILSLSARTVRRLLVRTQNRERTPRHGLILRHLGVTRRRHAPIPPRRAAVTAAVVAPAAPVAGVVAAAAVVEAAEVPAAEVPLRTRGTKFFT